MTIYRLRGETRFSSFARQLQDNWRTKHNIPIGSYKDKKGEYHKLGNHIENEYAFKTGANFLTRNILSIVQQSLENKEKSAKIETTRLFTNLLSSQPLAFNLFGELAHNTELATKYFRDLFPDKVHDIEEILFEHSLGRGDCEYTCDHSAFDVFVKYKNYSGQKGFIAIEVKYAENLKDKPSKDKPRYHELTAESNLFKPRSTEDLVKRPLQQIWRDHLLAIAHLKHKQSDYIEGCFVYLFPKENHECQSAVDRYISHFKSYDPNTKKYNEEMTGFYIRHLEEFIMRMRKFDGSEWTKELITRYLGEG